MVRRHTARLALLAAATAMLMAVAPTASAGGAQVDWGRFETLPGGAELGYDIDGFGVMVRTPGGDDGRTRVLVVVRGLDANETYPTHVHNQPCSYDPAGGGHYQHLVGGPVDMVNEMHPIVTTNSSGRGTGRAVHDHWARPEAQSVVIHYPANTAIRLACVDL